MTGNLLVGITGNHCVVIAAEKYYENQNNICSLDGKITVAWSGYSSESLMVVDKAKIYTNSIHGLNSPANRIVEFLIDPEIRVLNNLPTLPYTESFMVASCDNNGPNLFVTDTYGTISHVLASAVGRKSDLVTNFLVENYSTANKSILGTIEFALKTLCVISVPDTKIIGVSVTAFNRPFEVVDNNIISQFLSKIELSRIVVNDAVKINNI
ncbi:proteasome subunit alpha type-7-like [Melanaphis sacchari]|uniref:proteasome subunit alpha type-7-like n=1 Tax=Melanaphis sacchari TaxID=742174 RepID=UPI000DC144E3|nr:proteasome subunit alpha type-7-like [Melanaphis sacchari]